jgi:hypothetical protein
MRKYAKPWVWLFLFHRKSSQQFCWRRKTMFRDAGPVLASCHDLFEINSTPRKSWTALEGDPLSREKLEFRLGVIIQLMLRSEGGDALAREELKAIS